MFRFPLGLLVGSRHPTIFVMVWARDEGRGPTGHLVLSNHSNSGTLNTSGNVKHGIVIEANAELSEWTG